MKLCGCQGCGASYHLLDSGATLAQGTIWLWLLPSHSLISPPTLPFLGHDIPFSGFRSLVQAFTQIGSDVRVCTSPLLGRWAQIRELELHLYELFCDTLTTPPVAEVVSGHKMYECKACLHWCCSCVGWCAHSCCVLLGGHGRWMPGSIDSLTGHGSKVHRGRGVAIWMLLLCGCQGCGA